MLTAALWRIMIADHGAVGHLALVLRCPPACLGVVTVFVLRKGKDASTAGGRPIFLQDWSARFVVPYALIMILLEAAILGLSLDIRLPLAPADVSRIVVIAIALVLIMAGNRLPKLPWHPTEAPCPGQRDPRVIGRVLVAVGFADGLSTLVFNQPRSMAIAALAANFVFLAWIFG